MTSFKALWNKMADQYDTAASLLRQQANALTSEQLYNGERILDENGKPRKIVPAEAVQKIRSAHDLEAIANDIRREIRAA